MQGVQTGIQNIPVHIKQGVQYFYHEGIPKLPTPFKPFCDSSIITPNKLCGYFTRGDDFTPNIDTELRVTASISNSSSLFSKTIECLIEKEIIAAAIILARSGDDGTSVANRLAYAIIKIIFSEEALGMVELNALTPQEVDFARQETNRVVSICMSAPPSQNSSNDSSTFYFFCIVLPLIACTFLGTCVYLLRFKKITNPSEASLLIQENPIQERTPSYWHRIKANFNYYCCTFNNYCCTRR